MRRALQFIMRSLQTPIDGSLVQETSPVRTSDRTIRNQAPDKKRQTETRQDTNHQEDRFWRDYLDSEDNNRRDFRSKHRSRLDEQAPNHKQGPSQEM